MARQRGRFTKLLSYTGHVPLSGAARLGMKRVHGLLHFVRLAKGALAAKSHSFLGVFQSDTVPPRLPVAAMIVPEEPDEEATDSPIHVDVGLGKPVPGRRRELPLGDERADLGPVPVILTAGGFRESNVGQHGAEIVKGVCRAVSTLAVEQLVVLGAPHVLVLPGSDGHTIAALLTHRVHKVVQSSSIRRVAEILHLPQTDGIAVRVDSSVPFQLGLTVGVIQVEDGGTVVKTASERVERLELAGRAHAHGKLHLLTGDALAVRALDAVARVQIAPAQRADAECGHQRGPHEAHRRGQLQVSNRAQEHEAKLPAPRATFKAKRNPQCEAQLET
eukprot:gb/GEZJ01004832.1/.p1 GENE.gb/GEZJ01004832.1/~~gb/GEZJ01004832.1/.p1  ORF type:complete len:333 (+),score=20.54 gb/GEZJ01004832.1/:458-1456(+)